MVQSLVSVYKTHIPAMVKELPITAALIGIGTAGTLILAKISGVKELHLKHSILAAGSTVFLQRRVHELLVVGYLNYTGEENIECCGRFCCLAHVASLAALAIVGYQLSKRLNFNRGYGIFVVTPIALFAGGCPSAVAMHFHPYHHNH